MSPRVRFTVLFAVFLTGSLLVSGCANRQLIETPNLYAQAGLDPFQDCPPAFQNNEVEVLYATDRLPEDRRGGGREYGYKRSRSLAYGRAVVEFGEDVPWPVLAENSLKENRDVSLPLNLRQTVQLGRFPETPLPFVKQGNQLVEDPGAVAENERVSRAFQAEVSRRLAQTPQKDAYVFVHGYNNDFQHSVFVIAEIWHFLGRKGIPIAYSWPAGRGRLRGYNYDRESGEFTIHHLKNFLKLLASCPDLERIHLLAHSRGTDVLTSAIRELVIETRAEGKNPHEVFKIADVTLAAPDLDFEVFIQRIAAEKVGLGLGRVTLYVSEEDKAIGLSTWLFFGMKRVGRLAYEDLDQSLRTRLGQIPNAAIVDARVHSGFVGHSYFYSHPAVSSDLILSMGQGRYPGTENGRPLEPVGPNFWRIEKGYPTQ